MIVDDSPVARRLLERVLGRAGFEVVAELSDGGEVVETARAERVDVVILDLEMPKRSGRHVAMDLLHSDLEVGVLIYSGASEETLQALRDSVAWRSSCRIIAKGAGAGGGMDVLGAELLPMVGELGDELRQRAEQRAEQRSEERTEQRAGQRPERSVSRTGSDRREPAALNVPSVEANGEISLIVIGASTGGPEALRQVLGDLPADLPVPGAVVQHMPPGFTEQLAKRLNSQCAIEIREAQDGEVLEPGCILIAPGGKHLEIRRSGLAQRVVLSEVEPENSCRPAVDVLFRTAAESRAQRVLSVVLTGMGHDGLEGTKQVRAAGGWSIAQDAVTSVVWGMPGAIVKAGLAHEVLPLSEIGPRIVEHVTPNRSGRRGS